jgi:hypothetical protein
MCGMVEGDELSRIDYSALGAPDVWNGESSSANGKEIRVGNDEPLTAGVELTNRFGGNLTSHAVLTKPNETWLLSGSGPEDYRLSQISSIIGCPAPLTLVTADVSFAIDQNAVRNIAIWLSSSGPVMFDGGVIIPMRFAQQDGAISSIDAYFDPNDSRYVTVSAFENARGWFDPQFNEYNLLLPTNTATVMNEWLVCDMRRRKWFRKVPSAYPQNAFIVSDAAGGQYVYGSTDLVPRLMRLENGNTWDGQDIIHIIDTADILMSNSMWDVTLIRGIKALAVTESGDADVVAIARAPDGSGSFTSIGTLALTGSGRYQKGTFQTNLQSWSHQFRLSVTTDDKAVAPRLIGIGYLYRIVREELI